MPGTDADDPKLAGWQPPARPSFGTITGRYARLEPLGPTHAPALFAANAGADHIWRYMPYGPFAAEPAYCQWLAEVAGRDDPMFFAVVNLARERAEGVLSYLRIKPGAGSIEVGHVNFAPRLQNTRAATEALYLAMRWAFEAGYRRYEWKCDARNRASRRAAERLGLSYEGVFRQATVVKGRNRDTAWFAAIDAEWPALREAYDAWLEPTNFDAAGRQRKPLSALTERILVARDPTLRDPT